MLKVVLDTNVLISGVITDLGPSGRIIEALQEGKIQLVVSSHLLQEFSGVVARPRIVRKYPKVIEHADDLLDYVRVNAILVAGIPEAAVVVDDPDDDFVIACAIEGSADYIVSGDPHLLDLRQYSDILILSPRRFVETVLG